MANFLTGFVAAFQAGYKMMPSKDDLEYKRLRNKYMKSRADYLDAKGSAPVDPNIAKGRELTVRGHELVNTGRQLDNDWKVKRNAGKTPGNDAGELIDDAGKGGYGQPQSAIPADDTYDTADASYEEAPAETDTADMGSFAPEDDTMFAASGGAVGIPMGGGGTMPRPSHMPRRPRVQMRGNALGYADGGKVEEKDDEEKVKVFRPGIPVHEGEDPYFNSRGMRASNRRVKDDGKWPKYADGGMVEDDEPDDETDDNDTLDPEYDEETSAGAIPTEYSSQARTAPVAGSAGFSYQAAHDAVRDGLTYNAKAAGLDRPAGVQDPARQKGAQAYASGQGAAQPSMMEQVRRAVDPKGTMSESQRNMAGLAAVYEFYLKQGDPKKAQAAAGSMLQYYRQIFDRYKALSAVAAQNGDTDGAVKSAVRAYANVPDGQDITVKKNEDGTFAYDLKDEKTGKTVTKGVATPEQMLQLATKGAASNFDDLILRAAGGRAGPAKKEAGVAKLTDLDKASGMIEGVAESVTGDVKPDGPTKSFATHLMMDNGLLPREALDMAGELGDVNMVPEIAPKRAQDGSVMLSVNGRELKLKKNAFENLVALRGLSQKGRDKKVGAMGEEMRSDVKRGETEGRAGDAADRVRARQPAITPDRALPPTMASTGGSTDVFRRPGFYQDIEDAPPGSVPNPGLGELTRAR